MSDDISCLMSPKLKKLDCRFCGKSDIKSDQGRKSHERACSKNPDSKNYVQETAPEVKKPKSSSEIPASGDKEFDEELKRVVSSDPEPEVVTPAPEPESAPPGPAQVQPPQSPPPPASAPVSPPAQAQPQPEQKAEPEPSGKKTDWNKIGIFILIIVGIISILLGAYFLLRKPKPKDPAKRTAQPDQRNVYQQPQGPPQNQFGPGDYPV